MRDTLERLYHHEILDYEEAKEAVLRIGKGELNHSHIASFLTVYRMRSVSLDELRGFRDALLELRLAIDLDAYDPIDLCGTGGDGKDTFNISTLSSFVVAGAGIKVAKHGNYGVSSSCGSSNVMEHLGYEFTNDSDRIHRQIETAGICFLHAPLFHPAMKYVAPIRRELSVKTFFNMLGPMVNPSKPNKQLVGVFSLDLARLYSYLYQQSDKQYSILHAMDGYDEVSLTGDFKVISNSGEAVISPEDMGLGRVQQQEIHGGKTIEDAAKIFMDILGGKGTEAQNNVVMANTALAIRCATQENDLQACLEKARESLASGSAMEAFKKLLAA
jgi:anthranilate phosphoribosyltransferase